MVDLTSRILIPPPDFSIKISPTSLQMRPGDDENVLVIIKGYVNVVNAFVKFYSEQLNEADTILGFPQNSSEISSFGNNTSTLTVEIPSNLRKEQIGESKRLLLRIGANISFPTTITNTTLPFFIFFYFLFAKQFALLQSESNERKSTFNPSKST